MLLKKLLFAIGFVLPTYAFGQLNPPQVISLVPPDNSLENENLIETLCPATSVNLKTCRKEHLASKTWKLNAFEKPSADSKIFGQIEITGKPGKGLDAKFIETGKAAVNFPSDSNGTDWGYSSYFEFTVRNISDDWIQLPARPFSSPVWINIKKEWPKQGELDLRPTPQVLNTETVYSVRDLGDIVITKFSKKEFSYRKENPNDMLCGEEQKKNSPAELKELTKPIDVLYDKDGHLLAWPKYLRGC